MSHNKEIALRLTKEFLENKLKRELKWILVTPGTQLGDNYMSIIYAITAIEKENNSDIEHHWIFKCFPMHPIRKEYAKKTNMFYKELFIYTSWLMELEQLQINLKIKSTMVLKPAFPAFVGGQCTDYTSSLISIPTLRDDDPMQSFIILEDLRPQGFKMCDRQIGLDYEHLKLVVIELAKYHGMGWAYKVFHKLKTMDTKFPVLKYQMDADDLEVTFSILQRSIKTTVQALDVHYGRKDCELSLKLKGFVSTLERILETFYLQKDERILDGVFPGNFRPGTDKLWRVLCHGDCWINNLLFNYCEISSKSPSKVVLIDHAASRELCPMIEFAYLIYTSTTYTVRYNNIDKLLELYHDEFLKTCKHLKTKPLPGFALNMVKRKFRRAKLYGFAIAILALPDFLKNSTDIVDLDNMPCNENGYENEIFDKCMSSDSVSINPMFQQRIIELMEEIDETGILTNQ